MGDISIPSYRLRDELVIGIGESREECPQEEPACQDGRHPHYPRKPSHLNMTPGAGGQKFYNHADNKE
jgi:hypothetical protein